LGPLHDVQMQRDFVGCQLAVFPELVLVRDFLELRERRLIKATAMCMRSSKLGRLEQWVFGMVRDIAEKAGDRMSGDQLCLGVLGVARDAYAEVVRRRRAIDLSDLDTIHRTRVAFKKFRYVIETLSPGVSGFNNRQLGFLAAYQRKMGAVQDIETMLGCLTEFVQKYKAAEELLQPFSRYLLQRRTRAVCSFGRAAEDLFEFWPAGWHKSESDFIKNLP